MKRQDVRRAARRDAATTARIIGVQEAQIAHLKAQLTAAHAVITALASGVVLDVIDPETAEVRQVCLTVLGAGGET